MIKDIIEKVKNNSTEHIGCEGLFLVKGCVRGVTDGNKNYMNVTLQDKTGTIEAKKWELVDNDAEILKPGNIIKVLGDAYLYKDKPQVKIIKVSAVDKDSENIEDLIISSPIEFKELTKRFSELKDSIKNEDLKKILNNIFNKYYSSFVNYPAATVNHHDFYHGLLHHSVSMAEVCDFLASHYNDINRDLLISGALLHDIGKLFELSGEIGTKYTTEGHLLGHISIGMNIVREAALEEKITGEIPLLLEHMILSHHGHYEFGSPILPLTKEALILSMVDDLDSKLINLDKTMKDVQEGEFSERNFALDNRTFYKPKK